VSAVVKSDSPVAVQRTLRFNYKGIWDGQTTLVGSTSPGKNFNFAEGYTGPGFDEYLTLANPNDVTVPATVTYLFGDGTTQTQVVPLAAHSRSTVEVRRIVGSDREVAATVTAPDNIMVERPMYFIFQGRWTGGHVSGGLTAPATHLTFAEGYTGGGFAEYLTLLNPGAAPANVDITYLLPGGQSVRKSITVGPHSRATVDVNKDVPNTEVSADLQSSQPIVAERPMYFAYQGVVTGGHDVVGSTAPARYWLFPAGDTVGSTETYLTVANALDHSVTFTMYIYDDQGAVMTRNDAVGPHSRQTVNLGPEAGSGRRLGVQLAATDPVTVEMPTYGNDPTNGGSVSTGYSF
jgi:hypothetical protein